MPAKVIPRVDIPGERLLNRAPPGLPLARAGTCGGCCDSSARAGEVLRDFSSNVDEFFQVRVAGLLGQAESGLSVQSADGLTPQEALVQIRERVLDLTSRQSRIWKRELRPALAAQGIRSAESRTAGRRT